MDGWEWVKWEEAAEPSGADGGVAVQPGQRQGLAVLPEDARRLLSLRAPFGEGEAEEHGQRARPTGHEHW